MFPLKLPIRLLGLALSFSLLLIVLLRSQSSPAPPDTANPFHAAVEAGTPNLHFLFPATHMTTLACRTLLSSLVMGYEPVVINWGSKETGGKARQIKVKGVQNYLQNNVTDHRDLVFMVDAFDVWFQQSPEVLVRKFMEEPYRVLLGADKRCWPPSPDPDVDYCQGLPASPLPSNVYGSETDTGAELKHAHTFPLNRPRWPNSGTILARAGLLRPVYDDLTALAQERDANMGDQQLFMTLYHAHPEEPITLDMTSSLFQTLTYSADDISFLPAPHSLALPPAQLHPKVPLGINVASGETPVVLHFNGGEKALLTRSSGGREGWWGRMWFISGGQGTEEEREQLKAWVRWKVLKGGVRVAETGQWVSWEEMGCEKEEVWKDQ